MPNQAGSGVSIYDVLARLTGIQKRADGYDALCPAHEDEHPSLSVDEGERGIVLHCHVGCDTKDVCAKIGLTEADLFYDRRETPRINLNGHGRKSAGGSRRIVCTYPYHDTEGNLLFEVVRYEPKDFRQRRPAPDGNGWAWDMKGVQRVLFRLPKVILTVAQGRPVVLVEGEKDALNLERWDICATTNPGGAEKWDASYERALLNAHVVIVPDNDPAGRRHVLKIAKAIHGKAASVRILNLPGLPEKGDVSDWIAAGGSYDEFTRLLRETPVWTPGPKDGLPDVVVTDRPLRDLLEDAVKVLEQGNTPPRVFVRTGTLTRWRHDEKGRPLIETLSIAHVRNLLSESADWLQMGKTGVRHTAPPDHVVTGLLALGRWSLPSLDNITETPVLRADGSILDAPGYDPATKLVFAPVTGLVPPRVAEKPSDAEVQAALNLIGDAIGDFPYIDDASKANTLALLLTPILRPAITGPVPLALIDAPQQGTGKSLLAEIVTLITTGRPAAMMQAPKEDEEWRKALTSAFRNGETMMTYDNVESRIASPSLAMALTASVWRDRILGGSDMFEFPVSCTWMATGNNLQPDGDMPRRSYWIRLDAKMSQPWRRDAAGFKHPNLRGWVLEHRGRLITALLTLCRAWFAAGRPKADVPLMGSFESWTEVVGGVLAHAGVAGFLGNLDAMYEQIETTDQQWEAWLIEWREQYSAREKKVAEIVSDLRNGAPRPGTTAVMSPEFEQLRNLVPEDVRFDGDASEDRLRTRLGQAMKKRLGVRHGEEGYHLVYGEKDAHAKVQRWRVLTSAEVVQG